MAIPCHAPGICCLTSIKPMSADKRSRRWSGGHGKLAHQRHSLAHLPAARPSSGRLWSILDLRSHHSMRDCMGLCAAARDTGCVLNAQAVLPQKQPSEIPLHCWCGVLLMAAVCCARRLELGGSAGALQAVSWADPSKASSTRSCIPPVLLVSALQMAMWLPWIEQFPSHQLPVRHYLCRQSDQTAE